MISEFSKVLILSSVLLIGCTENEKQQMLDLAKDAMMTEDERAAKRQAEEHAKKQEKMEYIHNARYENLITRAEPEIRKIIAENLQEKQIPYSKIVIYDGYIHSPTNAKTPDNYIYSYKVDFYADIIQDNILTIQTQTLTGFVNFEFTFDNEDSYIINGYEYKNIHVTNEFSDITKAGARTLFDKLMQDDEQN